MIYLASPYSHPEELRRYRRYIAAREFLFHHISQGKVIFSPIVYCHQFARDFDAGYDAATWETLNNDMLSRAVELWVLQLEGWEKSLGVGREIHLAKTLSLPVTYYEPLAHANF